MSIQTLSNPGANPATCVLVKKVRFLHKWRAMKKPTWIQSGPLRRRQHQRILEPHHLPDTLRVDDLEAQQSFAVDVDINLARFANHMIEAIEGDLHEVALAIVDDAQQRQPLRLHLIAERKRSDLDFRPLSLEQLRYAVEKCLPLFLVELPSRHAVLLRQASRMHAACRTEIPPLHSRSPPSRSPTSR